MTAVPDGWEIGARLRADARGGTEGTVVFLGKRWAVLDTVGPYDVTAYYDDPCWELVPPFPPIPEDVGTIVLHRASRGVLAVREDDGWYQAGAPVPGWKPDPARWQQMVPKEQQP